MKIRMEEPRSNKCRINLESLVPSGSHPYHTLWEPPWSWQQPLLQLNVLDNIHGYTLCMALHHFQATKKNKIEDISVTYINTCLLARFWIFCLRFLVFLLPICLNYLTFQSVDFQRTWWRSFQKRVVCTKLDIYIIISKDS